MADDKFVEYKPGDKFPGKIGRTFDFCIEGLSVGYDYGDTVDNENYTDAYPFTGTVKKVTYDVCGEAIHDAEAVARRLLGRQ
jgi:hypothetical protein